MEMDGFRFLEDDEVVQAGDILKDLNAGEYRDIVDDTFDGLLIGMSVKAACSCGSVNAILRRAE